MGWNPSEKRKELFDKRSRFMIARKPLEPGDVDQGLAPEPQTTTPLAAFGMFRFDTEHDEEGEDEEVIYWSVRAFLAPTPLNDRCIPQLRGPGVNVCSTERSRKGNTRVDEAIRHEVQNEESCSHLSKRYCICFSVKKSLTRTMYSKRFCDGVLQTSRVRHSIDNEIMYLTRQCTDSVFMIFLPANVWKKVKKITPIMKFFAVIS